MYESMILDTLDRIKEDEMIAEMEVCNHLMECYMKTIVIAENCNDDDLDKFGVFHESFYQEGEKMDKFKEAIQKGIEAAKGKEGESKLKRIALVIVRFITGFVNFVKTESVNRKQLIKNLEKETIEFEKDLAKASDAEQNDFIREVNEAIKKDASHASKEKPITEFNVFFVDKEDFFEEEVTVGQFGRGPHGKGRNNYPNNGRNEHNNNNQDNNNNNQNNNNGRGFHGKRRNNDSRNKPKKADPLMMDTSIGDSNPRETAYSNAVPIMSANNDEKAEYIRKIQELEEQNMALIKDLQEIANELPNSRLEIKKEGSVTKLIIKSGRNPADIPWNALKRYTELNEIAFKSVLNANPGNMVQIYVDKTQAKRAKLTLNLVEWLRNMDKAEPEWVAQANSFESFKKTISDLQHQQSSTGNTGKGGIYGIGNPGGSTYDKHFNSLGYTILYKFLFPVMSLLSIIQHVLTGIYKGITRIIKRRKFYETRIVEKGNTQYVY